MIYYTAEHKILIQSRALRQWTSRSYPLESNADKTAIYTA